MIGPRRNNNNKGRHTMRRTSPSINRRQQRGLALDLFGQIPVLYSDIDLWMVHIAPRITGWRREWYITHWNIPEKIRQAKMAGAWPPG